MEFSKSKWWEHASPTSSVRSAVIAGARPLVWRAAALNPAIGMHDEVL